MVEGDSYMTAPTLDTQFYYAVYCAWCRQIIRYSTVEHSSGICPHCAENLRANARSIGLTKKSAKNGSKSRPANQQHG
jgi:hypothetical protein